MRDWTREEIQRIGYAVVALIAGHLSTLPGEPVFRPVPPELAQEFLSTPAPADARSADDILRAFQETIEPFPFCNGHPRFWGWVNSPPAVMGVFADALAAAMNPSYAGGNHAAIDVERQVLNWFRDILDFPARSMSLLVSGGSMATMTALAVGRPFQGRRSAACRAGLSASPDRTNVVVGRPFQGRRPAACRAGLSASPDRTNVVVGRPFQGRRPARLK